MTNAECRMQVKSRNEKPALDGGLRNLVAAHAPQGFCISSFCIVHFAFVFRLPFRRRPRTILDDFESIARWKALPADGVSLELHSDQGFAGEAMRMDVDFQGRGGYVIARRALDLALPDNYEFTFRIRGDLPRNNLEFKLIDETGENVWWLNQRNFEFTARLAARADPQAAHLVRVGSARRR